MTYLTHSLVCSALSVFSVNAFAKSSAPTPLPSASYEVSIDLTGDDSDRLFYTATDVVSGAVFSNEQDTNVLILPVGTYVIKGESNFCFTEHKTAHINADTQLELLVGCE